MNGPQRNVFTEYLALRRTSLPELCQRPFDPWGCV